MKTPILKGWWKHLRLWLHLFIFNRLEDDVKQLIIADLDEMNRRYSPDNYRSLIYYLIFQKPYRNLFYYRIGPVSRYLSIILKPYPLFYINDDNAVGGGAYVLNHPYSTIINAKEIGSNFTCCQLTTIGNVKHGRNDLKPSIGNNVSLGVNVTIIGEVKIGDNVIVGAGSAVTKDVPSNCVVVGNPAKVIRFVDSICPI